MTEVEGKIAFVTGGASGLGLGMARAFVDAGMRVVLADVRRAALDEALAGFADARERVHGVVLDVTDRSAMAAAAAEAERVFGEVHLLCNNAGLSVSGPIEEATYDDWDWAMRVLVGGPINGVHTFLPRMLRHGESAHIVNTASMSGVFANGEYGIYTTTKFAVVGLSEALRCELAGRNVGVSVYLPGPTRTNLSSYAELRPESFTTGYREPIPSEAQRKLTERPRVLMDPFEAGRRVLRGVVRNDLYIITHPEFRAGIVSRSEALLRAVPQERANALRRTLFASLTDSPIYAEQQPVPAFEDPPKPRSP